MTTLSDQPVGQSDVWFVCPDCGREYGGPWVCRGPKAHKHEPAHCVPPLAELFGHEAAEALRPYLDHAVFDGVVGDDIGIARAVLRRAEQAWCERLGA